MAISTAQDRKYYVTGGQCTRDEPIPNKHWCIGDQNCEYYCQGERIMKAKLLGQVITSEQARLLEAAPDLLAACGVNMPKCEDCGHHMHHAGFAWSGKNKIPRWRCQKCGHTTTKKGENDAS